MDVDPEIVAGLLRTVAAEELLPRFRSLKAHEVLAKASDADPDDIVTVADLAVERRLEAELARLLPGSVVVGEEAVAANPSLLRALSGDRPAWLVDPLDGTRNFAAGLETFGVMVALCEGGNARMAWIHLPTSGAMFIAEEGAGAWLDGERIAGPVSREAGHEPLAGTIYTRFMPAATRSDVEARAARHATLLPAHGSAASEYPALLRGDKDFVVYYRLLPWDHAPGGLILTEAGGALRRANGVAYRAIGGENLALAARSAGRWQELQEALLA